MTRVMECQGRVLHTGTSEQEEIDDLLEREEEEFRRMRERFDWDPLRDATHAVEEAELRRRTARRQRMREAGTAKVRSRRKW